jgi:hypothetical protein
MDSATSNQAHVAADSRDTVDPMAAICFTCLARVGQGLGWCFMCVGQYGQQHDASS